MCIFLADECHRREAIGQTATSAREQAKPPKFFLAIGTVPKHRLPPSSV